LGWKIGIGIFGNRVSGFSRAGGSIDDISYIGGGWIPMADLPAPDKHRAGGRQDIFRIIPSLQCDSDLVAYPFCLIGGDQVAVDKTDCDAAAGK